MSHQVVENIFNMTRDKLQLWMLDHGLKRYNADQLIRWLHKEGVKDWSMMTNLSKAVREQLAMSFSTQQPTLETAHQSSDGCIKFIVRLDDMNAVETVYIPERTRATLCVSSQVGCALNCSFCSTGKEGFNRNLTAAEIISQLWLVQDYLKKNISDAQKITNVVFMGMGEPLLNYGPVVDVADLMLDDLAYGLSKYRVTLSTSGVVPYMNRLSQDSLVSLAVSLHAANDALRTELVPINKKYPLNVLMQACRDFFTHQSKRQVTFEYVMLDGINDRPSDANNLIKLVSDIPCKINLIPFNPFPGTNYLASPDDVVHGFQKKLIHAGLNTRVRKRRGDDVNAACGQLAGQISDRTGRHHRWLKSGRLVPEKKVS